MSSCNDDTSKIDAIVTMDAKGQIVLPKDLREKADLKPTDKIAVIAYEKEGKVCCMVLIKAERLTGAVSKTLSPLLKRVIEKER